MIPSNEIINLTVKSNIGMGNSDHILIEELKQGEEKAFKQLVEKYQDKIYNTCISFVKNSEDADDLTQEVFIEIFHSIHKFRKDSKLSTWIYRITVNKSLEHLRKMKRKKRSGLLIWFGNDDQKEDLQIPDFEHPGVLVENREKAVILFKAIEKLPEKQRIAFTLHKVEDLSYEQIAEVMQKSLSSIESLMHRAKNNLKKELFVYYKSGL
jgi:RNA polymerase sigma factor (sigma-70 family)